MKIQSKRRNKSKKSMTTNIKIFLLCPVPEDQKPINEYIGLKENSLTSWITLSQKNYYKKIFSIISSLFVLSSIFEFSSFQGIYYLFDWIIENLFLAVNVLLILFLIILSRWTQINNRFNTARLFYEEASWYDGQIWEKPLALIKNDQFISTQKIKPILQRIKMTIRLFLCIDFILLLFLNI